jgi:hypothetical protein
MVMFGFMTAVLPVVSVNANTKATVCKSIGSNAGCTSNPNSGTSVQKIMELAVNVFSVIVGFVAVVMIVVSGFKYITSGGDAQSISSAKNTLTYAIVGLVVVVMAKTIVYFVFQRLK